MPHLPEITTVSPSFVLVVEADHEDSIGAAASDVLRAGKVALTVRKYLDQANMPRRVIQTGSALYQTGIASEFRMCILDHVRPTFTQSSVFSNIDPSTQDVDVYVHRMIQHLEAQVGVDAVVAVMNKVVVQRIIQKFTRGVYADILLKGGEACFVAKLDGSCLVFREPPPKP